jgi:hypothetical protein
MASAAPDTATTSASFAVALARRRAERVRKRHYVRMSRGGAAKMVAELGVCEFESVCFGGDFACGGSL